MELQDAIRQRCSVRRFKPEPVPRESVMRLLELACSAPHAGECWRFVVLREPADKEAVARAARQDWTASAPVVIVVGADYGMPSAHARRWDAAHFWTLYPVQTTAAAIQTLMLAAVEEGLGTCWIGSFNEGELGAAVGFEFPVRAVAAVVLGYPADEPTPRSRGPLESVVFWGPIGAS